VDAYGSPTIQSDLQTFDQQFGLANPTLNIIYPDGRVNWTPTATELGWAQETSLDVEWSHAMAPGATIDLLIAPTSNGDALNLAEQYAVTHHLGNVMSMSFGAPESAIAGVGNNLQLMQAHFIYGLARAQGMTVFASSGDNGATNGASSPNPLFPASDPLVTSVGGTNLFTSNSGAYQSETVW
ncbi:protease-like protein, partial [mine drainage metagenome]